MRLILHKRILMLINCLCLLVVMNTSSAAEIRTVNKTKNSPLVIESQVKGSQEQPNVIYILPWQKVKKVVTVDASKPKVVLPTFKPINPKVFKQQVTQYYQKTN